MNGKIAERDLFWHFPGYLQAQASIGAWRTTPAGAIRSGPWKLIQFFEDNHVELYHLADDIGEQHNLATERPAKAAKLLERLKAWRQRVAAPMPKPKQTHYDSSPPRDDRTARDRT